MVDAEMHQNAQICTLQFNFWGYAPEPPRWGGAAAPLPKPHPSALRASLGASIVPQCLLVVEATACQ